MAEVHQDLVCDIFVFRLTDDCLRKTPQENLDLAMIVGQAQWAKSLKWQIKEMSTHSEVNVMH